MLGPYTYPHMNFMLRESWMNLLMNPNWKAIDMYLDMAPSIDWDTFSKNTNPKAFEICLRNIQLCDMKILASNPAVLVPNTKILYEFLIEL